MHESTTDIDGLEIIQNASTNTQNITKSSSSILYYDFDPSLTNGGVQPKRILLKSFTLYYEDLCNKRKIIEKRIDNENNTKKRFNYKKFRRTTTNSITTTASTTSEHNTDRYLNDDVNKYNDDIKYLSKHNLFIEENYSNTRLLFNNNNNSVESIKVHKTNTTINLDEILRKPKRNDVCNVYEMEANNYDLVAPINNNGKLFIHYNKYVNKSTQTYNFYNDKLIQVDLLTMFNLNTATLISRSKKELVKIIDYYVSMLNIFNGNNTNTSDKSVQVSDNNNNSNSNMGNNSESFGQMLTNIFWLPSTITSVFNSSFFKKATSQIKI